MYSIWISYDDYRNWQVYAGWFVSSYEFFDEYVMSLYPEVREIRIRYVDDSISREFVFESIDYYAWFLLKVT